MGAKNQWLPRNAKAGNELRLVPHSVELRLSALLLELLPILSESWYHFLEMILSESWCRFLGLILPESWYHFLGMIEIYFLYCSDSVFTKLYTKYCK